MSPKGKGGPTAPNNLRHGVNNFTEWFASDPDMKGDYFGYDGPCPPFNDSLIHHYHFTLYALDIELLPLEGNFKCADVVKAMADHVLAEATITGTYTLNPRLAES
ncbi:YbhB/YbcL family Raf kinase inhibitor-like protein [Oligella ureolytica]